MTAKIAQIVRHPIKSIGFEELRTVDLEKDRWMPGDRIWAVTHQNAKVDGGWSAKSNFMRGVFAPQLMAIEATRDIETGRLILRHPEQGAITFTGADDTEVLDWLAPLWPDEFPKPTGFYQTTDHSHLSDVPDPWISINNLASLADLSTRAGSDLSIHRWRGNVWLEGLDPWVEMKWIGKRVQLGHALLEIAAQITRCKATMANPATGIRDVATLGLLDDLGHQEFGVYAKVLQSGQISVGDTAVVL